MSPPEPAAAPAPPPRAVPRAVAPAASPRSLPQTAPVSVAHGPVSVTINHGATFLVAGADGSIGPESGPEGLFSEDTRFLSGHRVLLNGRPMESLGYTQLSFRQARWLLSSEAVGGGRVTLAVERTISDHRLHEDLTLHAYGGATRSLVLDLRLSSDFADLFEVRTQEWQARTGVESLWREPAQLETRYRRDDFVRRTLLRIAPQDHRASYANGSLRFPVELAPGDDWHVCLQVDCLTSARSRPRWASCPQRQPLADRAERLRRRWQRTVARIDPADPRLLLAYDQAVEDFAALRLFDRDFSSDVWLPAAGIPWFVAIFGRDAIVASLQALAAHPLFAIGTLQELANWQSTGLDPARDAEPGKICHERRVGEWAHFGQIPHTPYYGTADATPLFLLLLAATHRWLGDASVLRPFRPVAERCLEWIDRYGDRDGDGLQEYERGTPGGYRNHCWRDAADGVLDEQGGLPPLPIGTCEMQAYVFGAKREVAELFAAWGDRPRARALWREAAELRRRFLTAYWVDPPGELAFALDGAKRPVLTATSNPGHCLWMGILDLGRGQRVAQRLLRPDLFTGWGLRTLSSDHPAYDPHEYQRGSVWPHDTLIAADGLRRYGRTADAWRLIDGILGAATGFERSQLPELFAGLSRRAADAPVPYPRANAPQAWAAGSVFHAVRLLLGLEPDVPRGILYIDPALPPWCPRLEMENIRVGGGRLWVRAWRRLDGSTDVRTAMQGVRLTVVRGPAPWRRIPPIAP